MPMLVQQQSGNKGTPGTTLVLTLGSAPTDGNTLVVSFGANNSVRLNSVTSTGATWVRATGATQDEMDVFIAQNVSSAAAAVTLNLSTTGPCAAAVFELVAPTTGELVIGSSVTINAGASTTYTSPSATPTTGRIAFVIAASSGATATSGPTGGYTQVGAYHYGHQSGYLEVASTTGSYNSTWDGPSYAFSAHTFVIDGGAAGGGGGGPPVSPGVFF